MRRTIVEPAEVTGDALSDLKSWLGITRPNEDDLLLDLLKAALATCEAFTGQTPLSQLVEERVSTCAGQTYLVSRPVASLATVEVIAQDGSRNVLDSADFEFTLDSTGGACFALNSSVEGQAVAIRVRSGLAGLWNDVPAPLKQGMIRLCAFHYRDRDRSGGKKGAGIPPASVSALWRPWRDIRLA